MLPVLTIAGSDPGGGAGIQADLKTFEAFEVFGLSVITALTAQNTQEVKEIFYIPVSFVEQQLITLLEDFSPKAVKTGMLPTPQIILSLTRILKQYSFPLVIDPVMISTSGHRLISSEAIEALQQELIPHALLLTPNTQELSLLSNISIHTFEDLQVAGEVLQEKYPRLWVLCKGGHLGGGDNNEVKDLLLGPGGINQVFLQPWIPIHAHGTGCTLSAAITACLGLGLSVPDAVHRARVYLQRALINAPAGLGQGATPLCHHVSSKC